MLDESSPVHDSRHHFVAYLGFKLEVTNRTKEEIEMRLSVPSTSGAQEITKRVSLDSRPVPPGKTITVKFDVKPDVEGYVPLSGELPDATSSAGVLPVISVVELFFLSPNGLKESDERAVDLISVVKYSYSRQPDEAGRRIMRNKLAVVDLGEVSALYQVAEREEAVVWKPGQPVPAVSLLGSAHRGLPSGSRYRLANHGVAAWPANTGEPEWLATTTTVTHKVI